MRVACGKGTGDGDTDMTERNNTREKKAGNG